MSGLIWFIWFLGLSGLLGCLTLKTYHSSLNTDLPSAYMDGLIR